MQRQDGTEYEMHLTEAPPQPGPSGQSCIEANWLQVILILSGVTLNVRLNCNVTSQCANVLCSWSNTHTVR